MSAYITPLYKSGDKKDPSNYRPISLTSICCKLMEKVIKDVMVENLIKHNLLSVHQHGFVLFKSCLTNLIETIDIVSESLNRGFKQLLYI